MRRFSNMVIVLLPLLTACDGGLAGGLQDIVWADTAYDLPLLPDAVVIGGDEARADNGIPQDTAWPIDPGAADPGVADLGAPDVAGLDIPKPPVDTIEGDAAFQDASGPGDAQEPCGSGGDVCQPGTTCRIDGEGNGLCVPMAVCDDEGTVDIAEVLAMLVLQDSVYVKVAAPVWLGAPSCSLIDCPKDSPCCNACFAQLFIGDETPIVLRGHDTMFACMGSECTFTQTCEPLAPGNRYRFWGRIQIYGKQVEFKVDGFCPLDDEADR